MAPPINRRTGFSRRAQYTTFFGYIAGIVGAVLGAGLLIASIIDPSAFSGLRGIAADAAAPAGRAVASGRNEGRTAFAIIGGFFMSGANKARLEKEAQLARVRLAEAEAVADENRRLKALMNLPQDEALPVARARLIAASASSTRRFATLSIGSEAGVTAGMPVRSPLGLVGRVLEVSGQTSRVLLITDAESLVPVRRARDGVAAYATGHSDGTLLLRLIDLGINPLKRGDVFVTSGSGGLYRPGIAVGVVSEVTRDGAIARVLSDPTSSEFVAVEPVWNGEAVNAAAKVAAPTGAGKR
ncbi:MAG: rod shape-determining protein MreC [Novosphingobium sp.]